MNSVFAVPLIGYITAGLVVSGCDRVCTADNRSAFNLDVLDARSGMHICDAEVVARDGDFVQRPGKSCFIQGPSERPGTYSLRISRAGYVTQEREIAVGEKDDCGHVATIQVTIELQPDGTGHISDAGGDSG